MKVNENIFFKTEKTSYTVKEIMVILDISETATRKLLKEGKFKVIKISNEYRIMRADFDYWLDGEVYA